MKFRAVVEVTLDIEARDERIARQLIRCEAPRTDVFGGGVDEGCYSIRSQRRVRIVSLEQKKGAGR